MSRNETLTETHSTKEPMMELTRNPYRPNIRRITSPQTIRRVHWDILTLWTAAIGLSLATWVGFFHLITR